MPFYFHDSSSGSDSRLDDLDPTTFDRAWGLPNAPANNASKGGPKPRLMLALADDSDYGAQLNVYDLASTFRDYYDIHIVVGFSGSLTERFAALDIEVSVIPELGSSHPSVSAIRRFRSVVRSYRPSMIHCHLTRSSVVMRAVAWAEGIPVLYSAHRWPFAPGAANVRRASGWLAEIVGSQFTSHTVCVDEKSVEMARRYLRLESVSAVPCGLERVGEVARSATDHVRLVMIADFAEPYDLETAIRALTYLEPGSCRLRIAGRGPDLAKAVALAAELGVSGSVAFLGTCSDHGVLLADGDIYLQTMVGSGSVTPVLEAMRSGLPIVASESCGVDEIVEDSTAGFLVPTGDASSVAAAIRRLVDDRDLREKMGSVGREIFEENFTRSLMVERFAHVYAAVRNSR